MLVSKPRLKKVTETHEGTGQQQKGLVDVGAPIVAHGQPRGRQKPLEERVALFEHELAVAATMAALERGQGVLNICDDEPAPMAVWLPHAARVLGADPPPQTPTSLVHETAGPELVHYGTRMPGASNARAKAALGWIPEWPSWRRGFERELVDSAAQAVPGRPS